MMIFFNNLGKSWIAKCIFTVLALSMVAFWGLGGLANRGQQGGDAIVVGRRKVSTNELLKSFHQEHQKLSALFGGQYISPQKAIEMGLPEQVIQQTITRLLNTQMKEELGLIASNAAVQKYVENHPSFADVLGKFDKNIFYAYLHQNRLSEEQLAEKLQDELAMQHLGYALSSIAYAPEVLVKRVYRYQNEKRDVSAILIDPRKIKITTQPTEEEIKDYYEAYADRFMAPEYRSFSVIRLTPEQMLERIQISDADVDAVFEEQKDQYSVPEKRAVSQMRFDTAEEAKNAMVGLTPDNFNTVAQEKLGQTPEQTDFGFVTREELLSEMTEPVFTSKTGVVIGPIESQMGHHILLVRQIQKASTPSQDKIRAKIKERLALEKTYDTLYETTRQLEDILGAGGSLKQAAQELKLPILTVARTDIAGQLESEEALDEEIAVPDMIQKLFTLQEKDTTPIIENGTGFLVAQLDAIQPVHQKELKTVRQDVIELWTAEKQKEQLPKVVETVLAHVQSGKGVQAQTSYGTFQTFNQKGMKRSDITNIPTMAMPEIFAQKQGVENAIQIPLAEGVLIAVTNKISSPSEEDTEALKATRAELKTTVGEELSADVMAAYANDIGVKINDTEIKKAFSIYLKDGE